MAITTLLALMVRADGETLDIETLNAEALLEILLRDRSTGAIKADLFAALDPQYHVEHQRELFDLLDALPMAQKLDLLRAIWMIAVCDGELHASESALIHRFCDRLIRRHKVRSMRVKQVPTADRPALN